MAITLILWVFFIKRLTIHPINRLHKRLNKNLEYYYLFTIPSQSGSALYINGKIKYKLILVNLLEDIQMLIDYLI